MPRRFAQDTGVPIGKSRSEIDKLLQQWGASGVRWTDEWDRDVVTLRFQWPHEGHTFRARIRIALPSRESFHDKALDGRTGLVSTNKLDKLLGTRGKQEHRLLLLMIKSLLNAVDAGVISDVEAFLPYLEGKDGKTVGEVGTANLAMLATSSAVRLLPGKVDPYG